MAFSFDHAIIAVNDLDKAVEDYRTAGFSVMYGGEHAAGTTHNAIIPFKDGSYMELMAKTGKAPIEGSNATNFARYVTEEEGVSAIAVVCDDLKAQVAALKEKGVKTTDPIYGERRRRDGLQVQWYLAMLPDEWPIAILLQDETPRSLRIPDEEEQVTHSNGAQGVKSVVYLASDTKEQTKNLAFLLGTPPIETTELGSTFEIKDTQLNLTRPEAKLTKMFHEQNGDAIWRIVLRGVGDMYKRLSSASLHGAHIIIAGER